MLMGVVVISRMGRRYLQTFLIFSIIQDLKIYLVVGGRYGGYLSSTETWSPSQSSWTTVSPLPRTFAYGEAVNLHNMIYLIGKSKK